MAEKMITLGKKNTLASRRAALAYITKEDVVTKLFSEIAPGYAKRNGGYTRILKIGVRRGDAAEMAIVQLVEADAAEVVEAPKAEAKKPAAKKPAAKKPAAKKVEAPAADAEEKPAPKKRTTTKKKVEEAPAATDAE